tara:strand:- start:1608 stop:2438 length:831 start_codon:yes stop_codon:yes gene_type:complete
MPSESVEIVEPSSLETIDSAIYYYLDEVLNLSCTTNDGFKKVPIVWHGSERPYQIKNNKELRDSVGKLKLPIISVQRSSVSRDDNFKGGFQATIGEVNDYRGGTVAVTKVIKQDKTRNFANADRLRKSKSRGDETGRTDNSKIVYETITVPVPTYVTCMYDIKVKTEYQQQMNEILPGFVFDTKNSFLAEYDGHRYEAFIEDNYNINNVTDLGSEERVFESTINIKVLGYLLAEGPNRDRPKITRRENQVEVRITRERVIVGDTRPWAKDDGKYRP